MRWPGRIAAGRRESNVITHLDWFPTVAAVIGKKPDFATTGRGTPIAAITGAEQSRRSESVFAQYRQLRMLRAGGWKLVRHFGNPKGDELFNLVEDPHERANLLRKLLVPIALVHAAT